MQLQGTVYCHSSNSQQIFRKCIHKNFLSDLKNKEFTSKYVIPHVIKKRAVYTEILAENANPKSIFELPPKSVERVEYEKACKHITDKVFKNG